MGILFYGSNFTSFVWYVFISAKGAFLSALSRLCHFAALFELVELRHTIGKYFEDIYST